MKSLGKLADAIEELPWILKIILVIVCGLYGNLIRLFRSCGKENVLGIVLAIVLLITAGAFGIVWIFDIICVILNKKIWWID